MDINENRESMIKTRRQQRKELRLRIQALYEEMQQNVCDSQDNRWTELLNLTEEYSKAAIWSYLSRKSSANANNYQEIVQMGRIELWGENVLESYKTSLEDHPGWMFAEYAKGTYMNQAKEYLTECYDYRKKFVSENEQRTDENGEKLKTDREDYQEYLKDKYAEEMRELSEVISRRYMQMVMNSDEEPFQIILLCYSKILPVVLRQTNCFSADGWAWKTMQGKTMFKLSDAFVLAFNSAVQIIQVAFGESYMSKLEQPFEDYEKKGYAVFTDLYEQKNTKNWVARLNKKIMTDLVQTIMADSTTDDAVKKLVGESRIYREIADNKKRK